jgi:NAD(P) transhydrogenase subunit alpha
MSTITDSAVLVVVVIIGFEVIAKVRDVLHTPLMSGANPINGVVLFGAILTIGILTIAILATGFAHGVLDDMLLVIGITLATINVIGGLLVVERMLGMFKRKLDPPESAGGGRQH